MALGKELERKLQNVWPGWLLACFLVAGSIAGYYYHNCKPWRDTITFGASVVGALFAIYSFRAGVEQNKRQMAHHLIERWNNPQMEEQKNVLRAVRWGGLDPEEFARPRTKDFSSYTEKEKREWGDTRSKIVAVLSFCEEIALSVNAGSIREDLMKRWLENVLIDTFVDLLPWIEAENQKGKTGPLEIYDELEALALRWKGEKTRTALAKKVKDERAAAARATGNN